MNVLTEPRKREERNVVSTLETVEIESGRRTVLAEFDELIEAPNWTPDGKHLIYNSRGRVFEFEIGAGRSREIDSGFVDDCNNDHVLSLDGSKIGLSSATYEDGRSRIYVIPRDGGLPLLVTPIAPSYLHGWSPDGKTLAYCAERNGRYDIYTIPAEGGRETRLTDEPGLDDGPEYAPDGRHIWFNSVRSGLMQIWRMEADGSNPTRMVISDSNDWFPHVSPDGKLVSFISYAKGDVEPGDHPPNKNVEIRIIPALGGEPRTLVKLFGGQGTLNVNSWAPDGKRIAFVSYRLKEDRTRS